MRHAVIKTLAAGAILSLAAAACSSSNSASGNSSNGNSSSASGKPLVVDDTPLSPMTDTFNPYSATSTGHVVTADSLYNEPLFIWNILNPHEAAVPGPGHRVSWSNSGKTLTLTTRSGVKWNDGKPFTASDVAFTFDMVDEVPA